MVAQLNTYLRSLDKPELIALISRLSKQIPELGQYFQLQLNRTATMDVVEKYKKSIEKEFFPSRGYGKARLSVARKPVDTFKRIAPQSPQLVDLMFHYVEQGVRFTLAYGDIDEPFYLSMETMFEKALALAKKIDELEQNKKRSREIVVATCGMGWGFHDQLSEIHCLFYKEKCRKCGY